MPELLFFTRQSWQGISVPAFHSLQSAGIPYFKSRTGKMADACNIGRTFMLKRRRNRKRRFFLCIRTRWQNRFRFCRKISEKLNKNGTYKK